MSVERRALIASVLALWLGAAGTGCVFAVDHEQLEDTDLTSPDGGEDADTDPSDVDLGADTDAGDSDTDTDTDQLALELTAVPAVDEAAVWFEGEDTVFSVEFVCGPQGCETECQLNGADFEACTSPFEGTVGQGQHEVVVRATIEGQEPVEESASFDRVRSFGLTVDAPGAGEVYYRDLGQVQVSCDGEDCEVSCEVCAEGSCAPLADCESGADLELADPVSQIVASGCVRLGDEVSHCQEETRAYEVVAPVWEELSVGSAHSCGILADGSLWCWGSNNDGQLGYGGSETSSAEPQRVHGEWQTVSAGAEHSCGIQVDGSLWCWGQQEYGRLGDGGSARLAVPSPVQVGSDTSWEEVSVGGEQSCGRQGDDLYCWGFNTNGQLGVVAPESSVVQPSPVRAAQGGIVVAWIQVSAGEEHVCGLSDG